MRSFLCLCLLTAQVAGSAGASEYAGQQAREIKALSNQEQADFLAGRGMGFARVGELNQYPGPAHVLELRRELALTPAQEAAARDIQARMSVAARALGADIVEGERALDRVFADRTATAEEVLARTSRIGLLQGQVRAVHLAAHVEMRAVLDAAQIARYDDLRGYAGPAPATPGHAPRHAH